MTVLKRVFSSALLLLLLAATVPLVSQDDPFVPTLVPPTLVPNSDPGMVDALASESAVARIQRDGRVRVGILFNEVPFGLLNIRGEVAGFDADLARSMAELWGVEVEFMQVTRQTALEMLLSGQVDFLAAGQVHTREMDSQVEFSQTYYQGSMAVMVRNDDGAATPADLNGRRLGAVMGTPAVGAIGEWQNRTGSSVEVTEYLTLDQGLVALVNGEIDGLVSSRIRLSGMVQQDVVRILDEALGPQPYAIAMRRQDESLRHLVNRTLQFLATNGRMNEIYQANFPATSYPAGLIFVYEGLGEEMPPLEQFGTEITYPTQYVIPRIQGGQPIRIAGLPDTPAEDAPESEKRLYALNRAVADELVGRWGATAEYLPNSVENALELVAGGQADVAVGVRPNWEWAGRVDFSTPYFLHGDRLLVEQGSRYESFNELRGGRWVGVFASEPGSAEQVNELARSVNTEVNIFTMIREQDVPAYILEEENADVAFGDSLKLIPHLQARPEEFRLATRCPGCDPWYTREYVAFGVPHNDLDFRLLVEYTLQEIAQDGTLERLLQPVMLPEEIPTFDVWPGQANSFGISVMRR